MRGLGMTDAISPVAEVINTKGVFTALTAIVLSGLVIYIIATIKNHFANKMPNNGKLTMFRLFAKIGILEGRIESIEKRCDKIESRMDKIESKIENLDCSIKRFEIKLIQELADIKTLLVKVK